MRLVDLAKQLKISHTTVSRALNPEKQHLISAEVRKKILDLAEKNGYRPNRAARALVTGRTHTLGLILPTLLNSMFFNEQMSKLVSGVTSVLKNNNKYNCKIIVLPHDLPSWELDRESLTDDIEGLLISTQCNHFTDNAHYIPPKLSHFWNKPVVLLNLEINRGKNISFVTFSNFDAAKKAVTHLIKRKHREIALIYGEKKFEDSKGRYEGYLHALKEHHIQPKGHLIKQGNYSEESGYAATIQLFNQKQPKPTAIFCTNDEMAIGAMRALDNLRIRCPNEVAVMGFDGLALGHFVRPRLSTVTQPLTEIAQEGTQLLIDLIEKKVRGPVAKMVNSELIIRDSA